MSDTYRLYVQAVLTPEVEFGIHPESMEAIRESILEMSDEQKAELVDEAITRDGHDEPSFFDLELLDYEEEWDDG